MSVYRSVVWREGDDGSEWDVALSAFPTDEPLRIVHHEDDLYLTQEELRKIVRAALQDALNEDGKRAVFAALGITEPDATRTIRTTRTVS